MIGHPGKRASEVGLAAYSIGPHGQGEQCGRQDIPKEGLRSRTGEWLEHSERAGGLDAHGLFMTFCLTHPSVPSHTHQGGNKVKEHRIAKSGKEKKTRPSNIINQFRSLGSPQEVCMF